MLTGRARVESEVSDVSVTAPTGFKGVVALIGVTEFGEIGKTYSVGSWPDFRRKLGGHIASSDFPLLCRRILERGCRIRVTRAAHYTSVADKATIEGVRATITAGNVVYTATAVGPGYNKISVLTRAAISGAAASFDIVLSVAGFDELGQTIVDVPAAPSIAELLGINNQLSLVSIARFSDVAPITAAGGTLAGGVQVVGDIAAFDLLGDVSQANGIRAFDEDTDFIRISAPAYALPVVDAGLIAYASLRGDCRAWIRSPIGLNGDTAVDYRMGSGAYSHQPFDSWFGSMVYGDLEVIDPLTGNSKIIPALPDVLGAAGAKDIKNLDWYATAGQKRGRIFNALKVLYNLGSSGRAAEFDNLDIAGVNAVIDDKDYGVVYWGSSTLQRANTLLKFENVAELLIYISRAINPIARGELFDPNDIETWKTIWRKIDPILLAAQRDRAIWGYKYEGDQFIDKIEDAQVNSPANIDSGSYEAYVFLKPKVGLKYVQFKIVVTNSGARFDLVS